jgi:hypothetical protein
MSEPDYDWTLNLGDVDSPSALLYLLGIASDGSLYNHQTGTQLTDGDTVLQARLGGPASDLSGYPLEHGTDTDTPSDAHHAKTTELDELTDSDAVDIIVDTNSNLPAAGTADRIAFVYDTQEILRDDGENWQVVGDVSSGGADISDDGSLVVSSPSDIDFTTALTATDDGDGSASVSVEEEQIEDWVAGLLDAGNNLSSTYDDPGDTLTIDAEPSTISPDELNNVEWTAMLEGADADKPAAGTAGRYYFATDVHILYRDNGTSWVVEAGRGTASDPLPDQYVQSLNADDINSDVSDGTTRELLKVDSATAAAFGAFVFQHTPDVSTSAKTIWEGYGNDIEGATIQVSGRDQANFEYFYDTIQYGRFGGVSVIDTQESGSATTRNYSINGNKELQLSMSANTYQVTITGIAASTPS